MAKITKNFSAKLDFTEEMLPNNRKAQFFTILANRKTLLFKAGLITLLFFVPLLIVLSFKTVCVYQLYAQYQAETITYEYLQQYLSYTNLLASLVYVPCAVVASIGLAGLNRLVHQLIFGEGILFKEDYVLGIKNNWKQYAVYTFVLAMVYVIGRLLLFRYSENVVSVVLFFVLCIIAVPYYLVLLMYSNVYSSHGAELIKNAFYAQVKGGWKTIVYSIIVSIPCICIALFASGYLFLFLMIAYLLLLPLIALIGNSLFADVFDDAFNYLNNVEIVKKGLYVSPKEREIINQTHERLKNKL